MVLRVKCLVKIVATIVIVRPSVEGSADRVDSSVCGNANTMNVPNDVVRCVIERNATNPAVNL
jgi:hypothetical protein